MSWGGDANGNGGGWETGRWTDWDSQVDNNTYSTETGGWENQQGTNQWEGITAAVGNVALSDAEATMTNTSMVFKRRLPESNYPAPLSLEGLNKIRDLYRESSRDDDARALLLDGWDDYHMAFIYAFFRRMKCANCNKIHGYENDPSYKIYNDFRKELVSVNKPRPGEWDGEWNLVDAIMDITQDMFDSWKDTSHEIEQMYFHEVKDEECEFPAEPKSPVDGGLEFANLRRINVGHDNGSSWEETYGQFSGGSSDVVEEKMNVFTGAIGRIVGSKDSKIAEIKEITGCEDVRVPRRNDGNSSRGPREIIQITLKGTSQQISDARHMIQGIADAWANAQGTRGAPGGGKRNENDTGSDYVEEEMEVFSGANGKIIGTRGASINEIREISGCVVDMPPKNNNTQREAHELVVITLKGTVQQIAEARRLIQEIVDNWANAPRGGRQHRQARVEDNNYEGTTDFGGYGGSQGGNDTGNNNYGNQNDGVTTGESLETAGSVGGPTEWETVDTRYANW